MSSQEKIKRVAIIGTGVAGLAMAACLKQMDTGVEEIVLFDPHEDILQYNVGGALGLSGGTFVLEQIGCLPAFKKVAIPVHQIVISDGDEVLMNIDLQALKHRDPDILCEDAGRGDPLFYTIRWSALRKLLCEYTFRPAEHSEEGIVNEIKEADAKKTRVTYRNKKKFSYLSETRGKVSIYFVDSTMESDFDLVIGADGIKSLVRNHVFKPNQTILSLFPLASNFIPWTKGTTYTGLRVTQCVTPAKNHPRFQENQAFQTLEKYEGQLHQWVGDGCNVLTLAVGDQEGINYVMATISHEKEEMALPQNPSWIPEGGNKKDEVKKKLNNAGFHDYHDMHVLLDAAADNDAKIFDVGIRDNIFPYRNWSSTSGRVILIGDSAHATAPFLGQGANQAIQDAFCLAGLIYKFNNDKPIAPISVQLDSRLQNRDFFNFLIFIAMTYIYDWCKFAFDYFFVQQPFKPNKVQKLAYEFEKTRKFHATLLTISARLLGFIEAMSGMIGYQVKLYFFRFMGYTGLGKYLFLLPAKPVV